MLARKYLGRSLKEIEIAGMIRDLVWGATKHGMDMPPDFLMVGKALMTIEGIGKQLDPELDVFNDAKPHFLRLLAKRYSPEKLGNELLRSLARVSGVAGNMPEQVGEILEDLRKGHLSLRAGDPALPATADRLGRRLFVGMTAGSSVLAGAILVAVAHRREWLGFVLLALGALLMAGHVVRDWWRGWKERGR
jgi:ubiquinone biosynthesis protein